MLCPLQSRQHLVKFSGGLERRGILAEPLLNFPEGPHKKNYNCNLQLQGTCKDRENGSAEMVSHDDSDDSSGSASGDELRD